MYLKLMSKQPIKLSLWLSGRVLDLRLRGRWFKSPEALCCVPEYDTLSSAKYWFNPGRCPKHN